MNLLCDFAAEQRVGGAAGGGGDHQQRPQAMPDDVEAGVLQVDLLGDVGEVAYRVDPGQIL